jgi:hypothetical protein
LMLLLSTIICKVFKRTREVCQGTTRLVGTYKMPISTPWSKGAKRNNKINVFLKRKINKIRWRRLKP